MSNSTAGDKRMFPVAIDLGRFSGMQQESGTSEVRQGGLADAWSKRTGIPIDLTLFDEGASGWGAKGARRWQKDAAGHRDETFALARFLQLIESGRIQPGDYLLLENLDRLSREKIVPATNLLTSILMAGVRVVQLAPEELSLTAESDMLSIFRAVMELSRGHGESERKHQTVSASYAHNRTAVVGGSESFQGRLPLWVRREGKGKGARRRRIVPIPERVAVVKLIFLWAAQGMSAGAISVKLLADGVPPFGARRPRIDPKTGKQGRTRKGRLRWLKDGEDMGSGTWTRVYIASILAGRAAVGEFRIKTGEVIAIPAAVTEAEWSAAQAGLADRRQCHGRPPAVGPVPLFSSLVTEADSGHVYHVRTIRTNGKTRRVLSPRDPNTDEYGSGSFPEAVFEQAVLACLDEIDPAEVTGREGPDPVAVLSGRILAIRAKIDRQTAEIEASDEPAPKAILQMLSRWEAEAAALEEERRQAQQAAAHPLSETLGQAKGLLGALDTAEKRLRFRALLRQMVEEIRVLVVQRGWDQAAAVQMWFRGSAQVRSWMIVYRKDVMPSGRKAQRKKRERGEDVCVVRDLRPTHPALDLRRPEHVAALREELGLLDLRKA
jgi:hypothetical protein